MLRYFKPFDLQHSSGTNSTNGENSTQRRTRLYSPTSMGPFLVIAETKDGNLRSVRLSKMLIKEFGSRYVRATPLSKRKMRIVMGTRDAANALVQIDCSDAIFSIPLRMVETLGVIYVEPEEEADELKQARSFDKGKLFQLSNPPVVEVRRVRRKTGNGIEPLRTVIVTFSGKSLPSHVAVRCKTLCIQNSSM